MLEPVLRLFSIAVTWVKRVRSPCGAATEGDSARRSWVPLGKGVSFVLSFICGYTCLEAYAIARYRRCDRLDSQTLPCAQAAWPDFFIGLLGT